MKQDVTIKTSDLTDTLAYLEGLAKILDRLASERRGVDGPDQLLDDLQSVGEDQESSGVWEPLRYQFGVGMGFQYAAEGLAELRARLVERWAEVV